MDIQVSSNFERLIFITQNSSYTNGLYKTLDEKGKFKINKELQKILKILMVVPFLIMKQEKLLIMF